MRSPDEPSVGQEEVVDVVGGQDDDLDDDRFDDDLAETD